MTSASSSGRGRRSRSRSGSGAASPAPPGVAARRVALEALARIDDDGAYANLALSPVLDRADLSSADRALVTELVYGTTRMRRACDAVVDRYVLTPPDPPARRALRLGAYQLLFSRVPAHAAVGATVGATPAKARGFVNAVLRRVAAVAEEIEWPDEATALSYPDWIVARLVEDLGRDDALAALAAMNEPPEVHRRSDGYVQDLASGWVVELVGAEPGEVVVDLCAAPGGKATGVAGGGSWVAACEVRPSRARLLAGNARRHGEGRVAVVVADGVAPPFAPAVADRVLVDAPCSGLGALRHRPDARWRVDEGAVARLAEVQGRLLDAALPLLRPGGTLVYSVCTLTAAETTEVVEATLGRHPDLVVVDEAPPAPWRPHGRGYLVRPHDAGTDGMFVFRARVAAEE